MRGFLLCFLFFLNFPVNAKFAAWVQNIPCVQIKMKVKSCEKKNFSNEGKRFPIELVGVKVSGEILSSEPVQCSAAQKMDLTRYKETSFQDKTFFVIGGNCEDELSFKIKNYFCDTPGAMEIRDCFYNSLKRKEDLLLGEKS